MLTWGWKPFPHSQGRQRNRWNEGSSCEPSNSPNSHKILFGIPSDQITAATKTDVSDMGADVPSPSYFCWIWVIQVSGHKTSWKESFPRDVCLLKTPELDATVTWGMYVPPPFSTSSLNAILPSLKLSKKEPNQSNCLHLALSATKCQTLQQELQHFHPPSLQSRKTGTKQPKMYQRKESSHKWTEDGGSSWMTKGPAGEKPTWVSPHSLVSPLNLLPMHPFTWKCECTCGNIMTNGWNLCNVSKSSLSAHVTAFHRHLRHQHLHLICFLVRGWNAFNELQCFYVSPVNSALAWQQRSHRFPQAFAMGSTGLHPPLFIWKST